MEPTSAAIGIVPLLIILAICWKVGFVNTLKRVADMANNEVAVQAATHKATVIKRASELDDLSAETVEKAKANIKALNDFSL